jgi:hypothetical protein
MSGSVHTYARIEGNKVVELLNTTSDITTMFPPSLVWLDVTSTFGVEVGWVVTSPGEVGPPAAPTLTVEQKLDLLNSERQTREAAGVTFQPASADEPKTFPTSSYAQLRMMAAHIGADAGLWTAGSVLQIGNGQFVEMTSDEVIYLAHGIFSYALSCTNHTALLSGQIQAGSSPDITAGWPSNVLAAMP